MGRVLGLWACVVMAVAGTCAPAGATKPPKVALLYGDSLVWESTAPTLAAFGPKWSVVNTSYPGTAPCDWLKRVNADLVTYHPAVVTLATAGNSSSGCMEDPSTGVDWPYGSNGFFARYRSDLDAIFSAVSASGAQMVFIDDPPFQPAITDQDEVQIISIATQLAGRYHGVTISHSARVALSKNGAYTAYKHCKSSETAAMGCSNGKIVIRTITGAFAGIHFCPDGFTYPTGCTEYSSGELRFGKAIAAAAKHPSPVVP